MGEQSQLYQMPGPSLVSSEDVGRFEQEVRALITDNLRLAIDCTMTHHISSRVLGLLVAFQKEIVNRGGRLVLFGVTPAAERVFRVTQLDTVLRIAGTEEDARGQLES